MIVLFINCEKKTEEGVLRFNNFHKNMRQLLEPTVYYGNEITETIRTYDQLTDFIYDEVTFRIQERCKRKFESIEYVIVDGTCSFAPWADHMADALILIRKSVDSGKKIICHGFGHFAAYHYLATKFDKHYNIGKEKTGRQVDFEWEKATGDLRLKGHRICNSGVRVAEANRSFMDKSSHALAKGLTLASKFDYVVFDAKSGSKLMRNVKAPFSFFWKSKLFCTSKTLSKMKGDVLVETENGDPIVYTYRNLLSVQSFCPEILKMIKNWLMDHTNRFFETETIVPASNPYQTIAFENKLSSRKILCSSASQLKSSSKLMASRPKSSKFSTIDFQKPFVRCSGKYETLNERYLREEFKKKPLNMGRSRMLFKGKLSEMEIDNYVQRSPSRPSSSHKFREVQKDRWVGGADFINC